MVPKENIGDEQFSLGKGERDYRSCLFDKDAWETGTQKEKENYVYVL